MKLSKRLSLLTLAAMGVISGGADMARADTLQMGDHVTAYLEGAPYLGGVNAPGLFTLALNFNVHETGVPPQSGTSVYYAGEIGWDHAVAQTSGGSVRTLDKNAFATFCTQLTTDVTIGTTDSYNVVALSSVADLTKSAIGGMNVSNAIEQVIAQASLNGLGSADLATAQAADAGAQVAIWKILYDYNMTSASLNYSTGQLNWSNGVMGTWQGDAINDLSVVSPTNSFEAPMLGLASTTPTPGVQNQSILSVQLSPTPSSTPVPKSLAGGLVLLGFLGMTAAGRRGDKTSSKQLV